jgi:hypothetical protein
MSEEFTPEQIESAKRAAAILLGDDSYRLQNMLDRGQTVVKDDHFRLLRQVLVPSYSRIINCRFECECEDALLVPQGSSHVLIKGCYFSMAPHVSTALSLQDSSELIVEQNIFTRESAVLQGAVVQGNVITPLHNAPALIVA